jgi:hypothetical protein
MVCGTFVSDPILSAALDTGESYIIAFCTLVPYASLVNFVRHWSQQPGEKLTREAYSTSVQNAMMYDSPVSSAADKIGSETNVPQTISTIIINVERDANFAENIKHKEAMAKSITNDYKKYKFD